MTVFSHNCGKCSRSKDSARVSFLLVLHSLELTTQSDGEGVMNLLNYNKDKYAGYFHSTTFFGFRNVNKESRSSVTFFFFFFLRNKDHCKPRIKGSLGWTVCETVLPGNWTSFCTISMVQNE